MTSLTVREKGQTVREKEFDRWVKSVREREKPTLYPLGEGDLADIRVGPGQVCVIGGAPAAGKTAFIMQCVFNALQIDDELTAMVANVEMRPSDLLDRQLARLSGVGLDTIQERSFIDADANIEHAIETIEQISKRLTLMPPPFSIEHVADVAKPGQLVVLDYIQRFTPRKQSSDSRGSVNSIMNDLRLMADKGAAIIAVSAVGRQKSAKGNSGYDPQELNLASFKESGEVEYGADSAYILAPTDSLGSVTLRHVKARHTRMQDIPLIFEGSTQRFTPTSEIMAQNNG